MREKSKTSAVWDCGGSRNQTEVDQEKGKKVDTNPGKPTPEQEGKSDSGPHQKDDGHEKRDSVSPRWQTRSPRR